jgi:hypothetical protein
MKGGGYGSGDQGLNVLEAIRQVQAFQLVRKSKGTEAGQDGIETRTGSRGQCLEGVEN